MLSVNEEIPETVPEYFEINNLIKKKQHSFRENYNLEAAI